jgi:SAM-dependent methyltransferase
MGVSSAPWWRSYFDDRYFEMHDPLFGEARSRAEVAGMCELLALPVDARILDAPCGWGRHTNLLTQAGLRVLGADISVDLLRRAAAAMPPSGGPAWVAADIRRLPFADGAFDAVLNVFTSLGLFLDDAEDIAALREAHRLLVPGGALLLESMHRDDVIRSFAARDEWTLPDGTHVQVRRRFDAVRGVSHERLRWRRGSESGSKAHALRLRTATEIAALLGAAGFVEVEYFGGFDGRPLTHRSESLVAVARRG